MVSRPSTVVLFCVALLGCGAPAPPPAGPTAIFAPAAPGTANDLTTLPFPCDLFLDGGGVVLRTLSPPLDPRPIHARLLEDLRQRDGFGVTTGAFFPVSGALDPATLTGRVRLVDLDDGAEIPVAIWFRAGDLLLHARPENGQVLLEHHRYAYLLLDGIAGPEGKLRAAPDFATTRDALTRPTDERLGRSWDLHRALWTHLPSTVAARDVVAAAVFTTGAVTRDLVAIRQALQAGPTPPLQISYIFAATRQSGDDGTLDELLGQPVAERPGNDNAGGIAHDAIAFVVQGSFISPDWIAATTPTGDAKVATKSRNGQLKRDVAGAPAAQGSATVPFTLVLPKAPAGGSYAGVPTVIFQHGLGGDRAAVMAVANTLARQGLAVAGIDIPFHGLRRGNAVDLQHNLNPQQAGPDGFADSDGAASSLASFFVLNGGDGVLPLEPAGLRGSFQQSVADIAAEVRLITAGSFDAVGQRDARLAGLSLRGDTVVYSGESFGSILGGIVVALDPKLGAAVLSVGGGGFITPLMGWSASFSVFNALLDGAVGTFASTDPPETDFGYQLVQLLGEPGDPLAWSPYVIRHPLAGAAPRHVLLLEALHDELVPNIATEALAGGMGLELASVKAGGTPRYDFSGAPVNVKAAPLQGNVGGVTGALVQMTEASHGMITSQHGSHTYDTTVRPFRKLAAPVPIVNPIDPLHAMYARFARDHLDGKVPTVIDP